MSIIKYMSVVTTCSVLTALISIVCQTFNSLKKLNKATAILTGLLAIESAIQQRPVTAPPPRVAIGYGACTDLLVNAIDFLHYTPELVQNVDFEGTVDEVKNVRELLQTFAYYFQIGAATERIMPNNILFAQLVERAKMKFRDHIQWYIGGNAALMGLRFHVEGAEVLLGARMSRKLRQLLPTAIKVAGDQIDEDDIHIILEYKTGDIWGPFTAPRANRYILHNDRNNPYLNSVEHFDEALLSFKPDLLVVSGLQMMDSYKFAPGVRESRLGLVQQQLATQPLSTLQHFEMASYMELKLLQLLRLHILPYVDSVGMNEQELVNLRQVLEFGRTAFASDSNPRVATTLDQMRHVFRMLAEDYFKHCEAEERELANVHATNETNSTQTPVEGGRRLTTRIHVHTLAYQALLSVHNSAWGNTKMAAAKAALTANRYVCQSYKINPKMATVVLDDSFATSADNAAQRIQFDPENPVPCWNETFILAAANHAVDVEICVAPVLVCRVAKKTAGAGDNISAAGLSQQLRR